MKVLLLTNIPAPYMVHYLNELGKKCELTALFERKSASDRNALWNCYRFENFQAIILKGINIGCEMALSFEQIRYIKKGKYDHIIIGNPMTPTGIVTILYLAFSRIPFCIQSEGGFQGSGVGLKERFKKFIVSRASFYLSGMGGDSNDYFSLYGDKDKKIYGYPFSSMYQSSIREKILGKDEKREIRRRLNIAEEKVIVSVGQFIPRKGMDVLIKACHDFDDSVGVYIIGGKPPEEYVQLARMCNIKRIHFIDFQPFDCVLDYMACCDVFVLATREDTWGLVINEAMSQGAPIITTKRCIAGTKLVQENKNGFLVGVEEVAELREKILYILLHDMRRDEMSAQSIRIIQEYSYEKMASVIYESLQQGVS